MLLFLNKIKLFSIAAILLFAALSFLPGRDLPLEDGDLIFQNSQSRQSKAIAAATHSPLTHVGVVFIERGVPYIYEAVQPVRRIAMKDWVKRGTNGNYVVRRLKDKSGVDMEALKRHVTSFVGKDYDSQFDWCDSQIYCSELVWKAYERSCGVKIGDLKRLEQFDLSHPEVKKTLVSRYGRKIPFDMQVISPADMFASSLLFTVIAK